MRIAPVSWQFCRDTEEAAEHFGLHFSGKFRDKLY